jgi:hypothetical protein
MSGKGFAVALLVAVFTASAVAQLSTYNNDTVFANSMGNH